MRKPIGELHDRLSIAGHMLITRGGMTKALHVLEHVGFESGGLVELYRELVHHFNAATAPATTRTAQ